MFPKSGKRSDDIPIDSHRLIMGLEQVDGLRPIGWGFIAMIGGGVLWVMFSVVAGVSAFGSGHADPGLMTPVYLFGILFFFSLPVAVVAEVVRYAKRRRHGHVESVNQQAVSARTAP